MRETLDWVVTVYDDRDEVLDFWVIEDRTEHEAEDEAMADVARIAGAADWTMTEVEDV